MSKVLVTGGSGFVAGWIIRKLIEKGDKDIRITVRSEEKGELVKTMLQHLNLDTSSLSYVIADLDSEKGWDEAMEGVEYVYHVASPMTGRDPNDPALIETAEKGTPYVLDAAIKANVKKIVLTSSGAACYPDHDDTNQAVDETYWTDPNHKLATRYQISKLHEEKLSWEIIGKQNKIPLVTILPHAIFGPFMDKRHSSTEMTFTYLLSGMQFPDSPMPFVDVRDLADLHILAMENPAANGQRFLVYNGEEPNFSEIGKIIKDNFGDIAKNMSEFAPDPGWKFHYTNIKSKTVLNWNPRLGKETIIDTMHYLIESGFVK